MNHTAVYWIWLQERLGPASRHISAVLEQPGTARFIYERTENDLWSLGCFPAHIIAKLSDKRLDSAERTVGICLRLGYDIVTPDDTGYPIRLLQIHNPPAVLYVDGELPEIDRNVCVSIVGTRSASPYCVALAQELSARLSRAGCIVVSGAARGIDSAAHQGALMARGSTVAVLGCGVNNSYNVAGRPMRELIAKSGALVSEYPPDCPPSQYSFLMRNRIISGLALGTVVVEAGYKSGAMNTARIACEQNRDVFAVPCAEGAVSSQGCMQLIEDGAKPVLSPRDVISEYTSLYPGKLSADEDIDTPLMLRRPRSSFSETLHDLYNEFLHAAAPDMLIPEYSKYYDEQPDECALFYDSDGIGTASDAEAAPQKLFRLYGELLPDYKQPVDGLGDAAFPFSGQTAAKPRRASRGSSAADEAEPPDTSSSHKASSGAAKKNTTPDGIAKPPLLSDEAWALFRHIKSEPATAADIAAAAGIAAGEALPLLTELELEGLIRALSGKRFVLS